MVTVYNCILPCDNSGLLVLYDCIPEGRYNYASGHTFLNHFGFGSSISNKSVSYTHLTLPTNREV